MIAVIGKTRKPHPPPLTAEQSARVTDNLGLVVWTIERHFGGLRRAHADDAFQDGVLGLLSAARCFDPGRERAFAAYAVPCIRRSIANGIHAREHRGRVRGLSFTDAQIIARKIPATEAQPAGEFAEECAEVIEAMATLNDNERDVIFRHYYGGRTLGKIGRNRGCSPQYIQQTRTQALRKLRRALKFKQLSNNGSPN